jgi:hypothetical protein
MKHPTWKFLTGALTTLGLFVALPVHAASLNLTQTEPDVFTDTTVVYTYNAICENDNGATGTCGDVASGGGSPTSREYDVARADLSSGSLSIDDLNGILFYDDGASQTGFGGDFTITALFDGFGTFLSGSLSISQISGPTLTGLSAAPTTIALGDIFNFGFSGTGSGGFLDFESTLTGGEWDALSVTGTTGTIAGTTISSGIPAGAWTTSLFTSSWSGSSTPDTFTVVPVPAAVWLFGSGLLALAGVSGRRRK